MVSSVHAEHCRFAIIQTSDCIEYRFGFAHQIGLQPLYLNRNAIEPRYLVKGFLKLAFEKTLTNSMDSQSPLPVQLLQNLPEYLF